MNKNLMQNLWGIWFSWFRRGETWFIAVYIS